MKKIISILLLSVSTLFAKDLESVLNKSDWHKIIGSWSGTSISGKELKVTYNWKYVGKVIEITIIEEKKETSAFMSYNPKTGKIAHFAADNKGGSSIGEWTFNGNEGILGLLYIDENLNEGGMEIQHLISENKMVISINRKPESKFELHRE